MSTAETAPPAKMTSGFVVFVGLATFGAMQLVAAFFAANATGSVVLQALIAEVGAGRARVFWSFDAKDKRPPSKRVSIGAALGAAFAVVLLGVGVATGTLHVASSPSPSIVTLLLGAAVAAAGAVRDELLLRGFVLRACGGHVPRWAVMVLAGLAAVAVTADLGDAAAIAARFFFGAAFGAVWMLDRGAFAACGANAALAFVTGPLASGGLLDLRPTGRLFTSATGLAASPAAAALAAAAAIVLAWKVRER